MRTGEEVTGRQMATLVLFSAGVCLDSLRVCESVCVCGQSEVCVKGQTLRDSWLHCQFYPQGLGRTFFLCCHQFVS